MPVVVPSTYADFLAALRVGDFNHDFAELRAATEFADTYMRDVVRGGKRVAAWWVKVSCSSTQPAAHVMPTDADCRLLTAALSRDTGRPAHS
jgi:hypothetical protein